MAMKVAGDKRGNGDGSRSDYNGDKGGGQATMIAISEGDGDSNKGGGQATAAAMIRAMVSGMRVGCNEEGNDNGSKSNGNKGDG